MVGEQHFTVGLSAPAAVFIDVPVEPEADEARTWVLDELGKVVYQEAKPTWFDQVASALWEWLTSLRIEGGGGAEPIGILLLAALIAAVIVGAFIIFGPPARRRRSRVTGELFGESDERSADAMRRDADRLAARGEWGAAIADMFRAIARGLAERTVVMVSPGTTAQHFAAKAAAAFPGSAAELHTCADVFDDVRYLGHDGSSDSFQRVAALERALRTGTPQLQPPPQREAAIGTEA